MTTDHPITPPPGLVDKWRNDWDRAKVKHLSTYAFIATQAARWGYEQAPKPPSLKELAYDALDTYVYGNPDPKDKERTYNAIRRALEQLDD